MLIEDLPADLYSALKERDWSDGEILAMKPRQMFNEYCTWHGLIGWGPNLYKLAKFCQSQESNRGGNDGN